MRTLDGDVWKRRGLSLLWGAEALVDLASPGEVASIRDLFHVSRSWPDELPSNDGNTLVVAGVEGCLDSLVPEDAESWLEDDLRPMLVSFQEEYEAQAALVLWLPTGRRRIVMNRANETYLWKCGAPYGDRQIEIGRILWGGAQDDAGRIMDPRSVSRDADGPAWIGLHHPRLS